MPSKHGRCEHVSVQLVEVWWATPRGPASLDSLLDDADRAHLAWLRDERVRAESATARALLRGVLTARSGRPATIGRECPRCGRPHGRPRVDGLQVSTSHTVGRVAVAVTAGNPVGIDVELDRAERFAELAITAAEWTRREAVFKAGQRSTAFDADTVDGRDAVDVDLGPGYAAAIAVAGHGRPQIVVSAADELVPAWAASAASPRRATG